MNALLNAETSKERWDLVREWTDAKQRVPCVPASELRESFRTRLNPPSGELAGAFDTQLRLLRDAMSAGIPAQSSSPHRKRY